MKPLAVVGAGAAALAGALVWAAISKFTGFEVGYIAWGIGLIVGLAAAKLGGRGKSNGIVCAIFALAAIFAGKYLAVEFAVSEMRSEFQQTLESSFDRAAYDKMLADANALRELPGEDAYSQFMVDHGYSEDDPTAKDVKNFKENWIPELNQIASGKMPFERWRQSNIAAFSQLQPSTFAILKDNLGLFDLLWLFLGVSTAYQVGSKSEEEDEEVTDTQSF